MIKLVDRYIGLAACLGMLFTWFALTLLFQISNLLNELRETQNHYGALDALWFVALTAPRVAYQVFPVSALLGALVGVGGLAAGNELVAFRTSGVSRLRLAFAALAGTFLMTIPVMIMGEWVAPAAEQQARAFRLSEMVNHPIMGGARGMWIRDGADFVNIQMPVLTADRGQQSVDFKKVVIYSFDSAAELKSITRAERAFHDGVSWSLHEVNNVSLTPEGATSTRAGLQAWPTEVKPELLDSAVSRPHLLSIRSLLGYLEYLDENGLENSIYLGALLEKILFPFTVLALVFAGMPFVFSQDRSHSIGVRLFFGMTLGGLFMIVSRAVEKFGAVYELPPILSLTAPILVLVIAAVVMLRRSV